MINKVIKAYYFIILLHLFGCEEDVVDMSRMERSKIADSNNMINQEVIDKKKELEWGTEYQHGLRELEGLSLSGIIHGIKNLKMKCQIVLSFISMFLRDQIVSLMKR